MSHMAREAAEAPEAVARFLERNAKALAEIGAHLKRRPPPVIITSARGSSDRAAGYFKYLAEILTGVPCSSMGASVVSVYGATLHLKDGLCVTISQSGKSPDIVALQDAARRAGALTVALVNVEDSPAAHAADICLPLHAGPELSVAATKSFIVSLVAGAAIVAHWLDHKDLLAAIAAPSRSTGKGGEDRLARSGRTRERCGVALCRGARAITAHCHGNGVEAERNLRHPCRGLFHCRSDAWSTRTPGRRVSRFWPIRRKIARGSLRVTRSTRCARPAPAFWWPRRAGFPLFAPAIPCSIPSRSSKRPIVLLRQLPWPVAATPTGRGFSKK